MSILGHARTTIECKEWDQSTFKNVTTLHLQWQLQAAVLLV